MRRTQKIATVFGGTGFIGRQVVRELAAQGMTVKIVSRVPEKAGRLKPCGNVGQIVAVTCDYSDDKSIAKAVKGSDYVVNCIGILYQKKKARFDRLHTQIPSCIAKACKTHGVKRFIHISALSADQASSRYAKTKRGGDTEVLKSFPAATILRPSVLFGPDDHFFNMFAELARYSPALPLIGGGQTKFQPVYVGDVADAVMAALTKNPSTVCGNTYELGGPEIVSFKEIYQRLFKETGRRRVLVTVPWSIAKMQAAFLGLMPKPVLTCDQVESLKTDNIVSGKALTLNDLGISATNMGVILPEYLDYYQPGGCFGDKKAA